MDFIKPAIPMNTTMDLIYGNAKHCVTTIMILRNHYDTTAQLIKIRVRVKITYQGGLDGPF